MSTAAASFTTQVPPQTCCNRQPSSPHACLSKNTRRRLSRSKTCALSSSNKTGTRQTASKKQNPLPTTTPEPSDQPENVFVQSIVSLATETLRLIMRPKPITEIVNTITPYAINDVDAVLKAIKHDFDQAYFVTGMLTEAAYDAKCQFVDPTVSFRGRELWKENLQLLVPFLIDPSIELYKLVKLDENQGSGSEKMPVVLYAEWRLKTGLKLPWKPYIDILGTTTYTLAYPDSNRIVKHVEAWNIDAFEAVKLVLTPGSWLNGNDDV